MKKIRLNKFISDSGVCSRREADDMIEAVGGKFKEKAIEEFGKIPELVKDFSGDFNINISGEGSPVTIEDMKTLLNSTGTKQLLINNLEGTFSLNNNVGDAWRT